MTIETEQSRVSRTTTWEIAALFAVLVAYPLWTYLPLPWDEWVGDIFRGNREGWWAFFGTIVLSHFPPFFVVMIAIRRSGGWASIGLDWGWFWQRKLLFAVVLATIMAGAWYSPGWLYPAGLPRMSESMFMMPVSSPERMFVLFGALTAAVTEEAMFRGFAITRLTRWVRTPWVAALISTASFALIHDTRTWIEVSIYVTAGLAFAIPFVLMKLRRLEILVLIHFLIDASIAYAP